MIGGFLGLLCASFVHFDSYIFVCVSVSIVVVILLHRCLFQFILISLMMQQFRVMSVCKKKDVASQIYGQMSLNRFKNV